MPELPLEFEFYLGPTLLGVITLSSEESDFPWCVGYLEPTEGYDVVRDIFDKQEDALRRGFGADGTEDEDAIAQADELWRQIGELHLQFVSRRTGERFENIAIHIDGRRVSWR